MLTHFTWLPLYWGLPGHMENLGLDKEGILGSWRDTQGKRSERTFHLPISHVEDWPVLRLTLVPWSVSGFLTLTPQPSPQLWWLGSSSWSELTGILLSTLGWTASQLPLEGLCSYPSAFLLQPRLRWSFRFASLLGFVNLPRTSGFIQHIISHMLGWPKSSRGFFIK